MAFMKQQSLIILIVLLLFCTSPTETRVVESVAECSQFFLQKKSPNIPEILVKGNILEQNRYKPICQTLANTARFVTLYDTFNKIPVFSASKYRGHTQEDPTNVGRPKQYRGHTNGRPKQYRGHTNGRPKPRWMIEPELEGINNDNMQSSKRTTYNYQAGIMDYTNNQSLDKGHLLPSCYGHTYMDKKSTFTLTNIVPQVNAFNTKSWNYMEQCVKCVLDKYCFNHNNQNEGFVVTGAQPSINRTLNNKINIPGLLWSAFCCYSSSQNKWLASAHWGENVEPQSDYLQTVSLEELHSKLGEEFDVFPETQCPLKTTVTEFYPQLEKKCNCPPPAPRTTTGTPVMTTPPTARSHTSQNSASTSSYLPTSSERATTRIRKYCMIRLGRYDPSQQLFLCSRHIQRMVRYCQVRRRSRYFRKVSRIYNSSSISIICKDHK